MTNNYFRYYLKNDSGDFLMIEDKILEFDTLSAVASFLSEVREDDANFNKINPIIIHKGSVDFLQPRFNVTNLHLRYLVEYENKEFEIAFVDDNDKIVYI